MEVEMMEPEADCMKDTLQAMRGKGVKVGFLCYDRMKKDWEHSFFWLVIKLSGGE